MNGGDLTGLPDHKAILQRLLYVSHIGELME